MGFRDCSRPRMLPSCAPGFLSPPEMMEKEATATLWELVCRQQETTPGPG